MSFIRTKEIPPGSGRLYKYEVESYRESGKVKQRHIRYIGRAGSIGTTGTGITPLSSAKRRTPSIGTTPDKKSSPTPLTNHTVSGIIKSNKGEEKTMKKITEMTAKDIEVMSLDEMKAERNRVAAILDEKRAAKKAAQAAQDGTPESGEAYGRSAEEYRDILNQFTIWNVSIRNREDQEDQ
jgi:hypothetical protein